MNYLDIGASLYLPATRDDLANVGAGVSYPQLRSAIFCTEDAIKKSEISKALSNIKNTLKTLKKNSKPYCFVRPCCPEILQEILAMPNVDNLTGFVIPKFTLDNMHDWFNILKDYQQFLCMPILETEEVFDPNAMRALRDAILKSEVAKQVGIVRIGGLDLLNLMGIRRKCSCTIYDTVLNTTIQNLVTVFAPHGFYISAPVFECIDEPDYLYQEVQLDKLHGFYHKSIIHPDQINVMEDAYKVEQKDFEMAKAIVDPDTPPVFRLHGRMSEKTTHINWAKRVLRLVDLYGVKL